MVARPGTERTNFNAGEIAVELYDRTDVKTWYSGAALMDGAEPVPQGGYQQTPRSRHRAWVGRRTTAANVPLTPAPAGFAAVQLLAELDIGVTAPVAIIELDGFFLDAGVDIADLLSVNVSNTSGVDGVVIAPPLDVTTTPQRRRLAFAPGTPTTGRYLRFHIVVDPGAARVFSFGTVSAYMEKFDLVARPKPFGVTRDKAYTVLLAAGHADVFKQGVFVGSTWLPYTIDQVVDVSVTQRFDTMFLFHPDVAPHRILHRGTGDSDWTTDVAPFEHVPNVDLGGTYTNGVAEVWNIYYAFTGDAANFIDDSFSVNVNGEETAAVDIPGGGSGGGTTPDWPATGVALLAAINALASVGGGCTITTTSKKGVTEFAVTFGGDNTGNPYALAGKSLSTQDAAVTVGRRVKGVRPGEPIMSAARGWPRCGRFHQDRLLIGGFKAEAGAYLMSGPGEYFNMNILIEAPSAPILDRLDVDGAEAILQFVASKQLVVFTSASNRFLTNRAVTRNDPRNWAYSSNDGVAAGIPIVESEGSLLFINVERTMLMAATYSDVSQGYDIAPISLLAPHLIDLVRDMVLQKPQAETDSARLFLPRDDGLLIIGLVIRNQDITAFVRWSTDGAVRWASVDATNQASLVVERLVAGVPRLVLETLEQGLLFDQAVEQTFDPPTAIITGLDVLEGATVWAEADGFVEGPFVVAGGEIVLPETAAHVVVGRWTPTALTTLPLSKVISSNVVVLQRPCRVHTVRLKLLETSSIAVGANARPSRDQPLARWGLPADAPMPPFSGPLVVAGLSGFTAEGQVTISQLRPGRLQVRSLTVEAKT